MAGEVFQLLRVLHLKTVLHTTTRDKFLLTMNACLFLPKFLTQRFSGIELSVRYHSGMLPCLPHVVPSRYADWGNGQVILLHKTD